MICKTITVNKTTLSDLIKFQKIEFRIIRGYRWQGTKDYSISKLIDSLFQSRKKLKAEKNPLESVYKLILNNIYGKTIQKPILTDVKYIRSEEAVNKYIIRNHVKFISAGEVKTKYTNIVLKEGEEDNRIYRVELHKATADFGNNCLLGGHILAKSKRIMNEVMCLAEDLGCKLYYQDTDSFFIAKADLLQLEQRYKDLYHRELLGKDLGQFHLDFSTMDNRTDVLCATECYFVRKKLYCCKLLMQDNTFGITYRAKGITAEAIEKRATGRNPGMNTIDAIMELYKSVFNGEKIVINLAESKPMFKYDDHFQVRTLSSFTRTL
jgi:hypothetical protein